MAAAAVADHHTTRGLSEIEILHGIALVDHRSLHVGRRGAARDVGAARNVGEQRSPVVSRLCGRSTTSAGSRARHWSSHSPQHGDAFMHRRGALHGCGWSNVRRQLSRLSKPQPLHFFDWDAWTGCSVNYHSKEVPHLDRFCSRLGRTVA